MRVQQRIECGRKVGLFFAREMSPGGGNRQRIIETPPVACRTSFRRTHERTLLDNFGHFANYCPGRNVTRKVDAPSFFQSVWLLCDGRAEGAS